MMGLSGFDYTSSQDVLQRIPGLVFEETVRVSPDLLTNRTSCGVELSGSSVEPVVASIYALDGLVRRSPALQLTADARAALLQEVAA
jgi:NADH-quinone oxidoreductase subunit G